MTDGIVRTRIVSQLVQIIDLLTFHINHPLYDIAMHSAQSLMCRQPAIRACYDGSTELRKLESIWDMMQEDWTWRGVGHVVGMARVAFYEAGIEYIMPCLGADMEVRRIQRERGKVLM